MPLIFEKTFGEAFLRRVQLSPNAIGFQFKVPGSSTWKGVSFKDFYSDCRLVSFGLMGLGIRPKDRVAILSNTRFEWSLCDMAIIGAQAVTVPIYASNTPDDVAFILEHSEARVAFVENEKQLKKLIEKKVSDPSRLKNLEKIIVFEPQAMRVVQTAEAYSKDTMTLDALREWGKREEVKNPGKFDGHLKEALPTDVITICYTSGTTGVPKGVVLDHGNLMSVVTDCAQALLHELRPEKEVILSFLPFSHIFGKAESLAIYVFGWRQAYAESLDRLMDNFKEIKPTLFFSVPRIFEKAYNRISSTVEGAKPAQKVLFNWALKVGRTYWEAKWNQKPPSVRNLVEYQLAKKLIFQKVAQGFGGNLRFAISGGAPLSREIGEFFQIVGVAILEGYGLTETSSAVSLNIPGQVQFGTVGKPLSDVSFKIAEDGEILIQSRKVFKSYYKMPEETAQVLSNGWFKTGDIGHIAPDGVLHVTDRKKDLIVTSAGKNIAPQKLENMAIAQKLFTQFVVHGDRRNYLTALITLDRDSVIVYANQQNILFSEYGELIKHPKILGLVQKLVNEMNQKLASFETVKKFVILPNEFTIETGELTPSLKIKRNFVTKKYQAELDSMYDEPLSGSKSLS